jgi:hypothetical protein
MVGVALTALPLLASFPWLRILGPVVVAMLIARAVVRGPIVVRIVCILLGLTLSAVTLRSYVERSNEEFFYGGELLFSEEGSAFHGVNGVPLTDDPSEGEQRHQVLGEPAVFVVSCWRPGAFDGKSARWAFIEDGDYKGLWIPLAYLYPMAAGRAGSLLPCTDWRWRLTRIGDWG